MFFEPFPKIDYNTFDDNHREMVNIVIANMIKRHHIDKKYAFRVYENKTRKSIESISYELYRDGRYWWTILVANDLLTPYTLTFHKNKVREYCMEKYGKDKIYTIHHYFNINTNRIVDDLDTLKYNSGEKLPYYIHPITNFEYEQQLSMDLDRLYYISPSYIETFIEEYRREIKGN